MKVSNEMPSRTDQDSVCALTGRFQSLKGQLIDCSSHSLTLSTFWKIVFKEFNQMMRIQHETGTGGHTVQFLLLPSPTCVSLHTTYQS